MVRWLVVGDSIVCIKYLPLTLLLTLQISRVVTNTRALFSTTKVRWRLSATDAAQEKGAIAC